MSCKVIQLPNPLSHPGPDTQGEDNAFNLFLVTYFLSYEISELIEKKNYIYNNIWPAMHHIT